MSKEGYLQLKIRELDEKLQKSEEKINTLIGDINKKEQQINLLIESISPKIKEAEEINKKEQEVSEGMSKTLEEVKQFHSKHYNQMYKNILREVNKTLAKVKDAVNFTIIDHTTNSFVLLKYLQDKGLVNPIEMLQYIHKYHDEVRDANIQSGMPQKSLEIFEVKDGGQITPPSAGSDELA